MTQEIKNFSCQASSSFLRAWNYKAPPPIPLVHLRENGGRKRKETGGGSERGANRKPGGGQMAAFTGWWRRILVARNRWTTTTASKEAVHHATFFNGLRTSFTTDESELVVDSKKVQKQSNGVDCGLYALTFATNLLNGMIPEKQTYSVTNLRLHVFQCIKGP